MLICPECGFRQDDEAQIRLPVCRRCQTQGREVYLSGGKPNRRCDLIGLLSAARAQLAESRDRFDKRAAAPGTPGSAWGPEPGVARESTRKGSEEDS